MAGGGIYDDEGAIREGEKISGGPCGSAFYVEAECYK